ncbi:hypothetical protein HME9304_00769 [Flagellimonas maritima]|uniref:Uncharacterized protein n=1 Tax=Flagellimonas maritima TaxID=1383885 RepID=A0A2Z4LQV4_9FLAO|nr:hypothetical protein [Allomuricauda aurantiaca]AWX43778.1 hypothetical protein HME9304_00769 [Allomuricauda aurantiaca]
MTNDKVLIQWIEDTYGIPEELAKVLDYGIEMLFYLKPDSFEPKEVQEVVSAMRGLIIGLRS